MYKTVRHGENSLQYTILPQQDDSTGNNYPQKPASGLCRGRQHRRGRGGRTTTILVVTLLVVCSIVAGTILVPLLLTTDILAFHKLQSSTGKVIIHHKPRLSQHKLENLTTTTTTTTTTPTTTSEENLNTLTTAADVSNVSVKAFLLELPEGNVSDAETTLALTVTTDKVDGTTAKEERNVSDEVDSNETMAWPRNGHVVAEMTPPPVWQQRAMPPREEGVTTTTRTTPVASTTPLPTTVKPTVDPYQRWLPRWPFAESSSYLQWTGLAGGHYDLVLPIVLTSIVLVALFLIVLFYFLRRKRQRLMRREAIGKMSSDLQSDESADKTNLLHDQSEEE